jgi:zinc protease
MNGRMGRRTGSRWPGKRIGRQGGTPGVDERLSAADVRRLPSGLVVGVLPSHRAPVVASALAYCAGARDEAPGVGGTAHFLEHMMFKGSAGFGPGEIDRQTRALGGNNNAYTSHDLTLYYFTFAADRWQRALDVEVDRMTGLLLDPQEVDSERQVIYEELAMYESEPWDALDDAVHAAFFPSHPYGRPVIGTRDQLASIDAQVLGAFHRRFYRPTGAVISVVGDVDVEAAHAAVAERFGDLGRSDHDGDLEARPPVAVDDGFAGMRRVERRHGELARLLVALPAPAAGHDDHPILRLLLAILGSGRSSRLQRALVDDGQSCVWVSTDVHDSLDPGIATVAAEAVPGADPAAIEAEVCGQLARLVAEPPSADEIARAQRMLFADRLFGHEKVDQQSFLLATSLALFDLDFPARYLKRLFSATAEDLLRVASLYLRPERRSVVGWSLPEDDAAEDDAAENDADGEETT